jgi:hypothetical protein
VTNPSIAVIVRPAVADRRVPLSSLCIVPTSYSRVEIP